MNRYTALFVVISIIVLVQETIATSTQVFYYKSDRSEFSLSINSNFKDADSKIIDNVKKYLPYFIFLESRSELSKKYIGMFISCNDQHKAILEIDQKRIREVDCSDDNINDVISNFSELLGTEAKPKNKFNGYTIQVAYVKKGKNCSLERYLWASRLDKISERSSVKIVGEVMQKPIWIYEYPDGGSGIRAGIFTTFLEAKKAIKKLGLKDLHSQIIPIEFNISSFDRYFYTLE